MSYTINIQDVTYEVDTPYEFAVVLSLLGLKQLPREVMEHLKHRESL